MNVVHQLNGLNGSQITRADLHKMYVNAKKQDQNKIASRIEAILNSYDDAYFDININSPHVEEIPAYITKNLPFEELPDEEYTGLNKAVSPDEIYQMITDKMIKLVELATGKGVEKPWDASLQSEFDEPGYLIPFNFDTKKQYRGVNVALLTDFGTTNLKNPFFLTFKQIEKHKGKLNAGSKGYKVVYFTTLYTYEQDEPKLDFGTYDKKRFIDWVNKNKYKINVLKDVDFDDFISQCTIPILKYYNVFNGVDVSGIDFDLDNFKIGYHNGKNEKPKNERIEIADLITDNYPEPAPTLKIGGDRAAYQRNTDIVFMPKMESFKSSQSYYSVLFHEFTHSSGSPDRLNRPKGAKFGDPKYAFEELIAEFGAVFLSAHAGIVWRNNVDHAEYLKNWKSALEFMKKDNRFLMRAASKAQAAADFILNLDKDGQPAYFSKLNTERSLLKKGKTAEVVKVNPSSLYFKFDGQNFAINVNGNFFKVADTSNILLALNSAQSIYITGSEKTDKKAVKDILKDLNIPYTDAPYTYDSGNAKPGDMFSFPAKMNIKKVEKPKEPEAPKRDTSKYPFSPTDIPYQTAYNAHSGTSFSPEKRAVQEQNMYFETLADMWDEFKPKAEKIDKLSDFKFEFSRLQAGYLKRKLAVLHSRNGLVSTMITGGSNFPVARMNKKNDAIHNKQGDMYSWLDKGRAKLVKLVTPPERLPIISGTDNALDLLKKKLDKELEMIRVTKEINKIIRKHNKVKDLDEKIKLILADLTDAGVKDTLRASVVKMITEEKRNKLPAFILTNANARKRELESRIAAEIKRNELLEGGKKEFEFEGGTVLLNEAENRLQILYDEKPDDAARAELKKNGFRWSGKFKAWQRQLTRAAMATASQLLGIDVDPNAKDKPVPSKKEDKPVRVLNERNPVVVEYEKQNPRVIKMSVYSSLSEAEKLKYVQNRIKQPEPQKVTKLKTKKPEVKPQTKSKEYAYHLRSRGFSIGTYPLNDSFLRYEDDKSRYGRIIYSDPLSLADIKKYELIPITEAEALNGKKLYRSVGKRIMEIELQLVNNGRKLYVFDIVQKLEGKRVENTVSVIDVLQNIDSKKWSFAKPKPEPVKTEVEKRNEAAKEGEQLALLGENPKGLPGGFVIASEGPKKQIDTFRLKGELGKLLGDLQAYQLAILLTGDPHAGKSEFLSQLTDAFLDIEMSGAYFDLEQGGLTSKDTKAAFNRNIKPGNQKKLAVTGEAPDGIDSVKAVADQFDFVVIDSFQELNEPISGFNQLRKEHPNTIFIVIFQQNGQGGTRGGIKGDYDAPVRLKVYKVDNTFVNNYAQVEKNRGNSIGGQYNVSQKKMINTEATPEASEETQIPVYRPTGNLIIH